MLKQTKVPISFALAILVYISFVTPTPAIFGHFRGQPIEPFSYYVIAADSEWSDQQRVSVCPAARRGFFGLSTDDRRRCWILFRMIVDIFRHSPERRETLERVITALSERPPVTVRTRSVTSSSAESTRRVDSS